MNSNYLMAMMMAAAAQEGGLFMGNHKKQDEIRNREKELRLERMARSLKRQADSRQLRKFVVNGKEVMAYSRKDALKKANRK